MIYCVWYPSGGFGHFVNAVLSLYGKNFVRPQGTLEFSPNGNSHSLDVVVPKYYQNHWPHNFEFDKTKNYSVLIDNGINDEGTRFKSYFPNATVIKICYSDHSWPVVARTMIDKAMTSNIETQLPTAEWDTDQPWAKREKYFLFLRDHQLRNAWRSENDNCIYVEHLFDYSNLYNRLNRFEKILPFKDSWNLWRETNSKYIDPCETADIAIQHIKNHQTFNLSHVTDIWAQAIIYYYVWLEFGVEVPHNDFANWIDSTDRITALL